MSRPMVGHRSADFSAILTDALNRAKRLFQTDQDVYVLSGTGTAGLEMAAANIIAPGDTVLVLVTGVFGERFVKIAEAYGANVKRIDAEWGFGVDVSKLRTELAADPSIKAVFATQSETSTGVSNDIQAIGNVVKTSQALLIVDAVSSLGAMELRMDEWNVDICVTGSQKALMLPPGLALVAVSEQAWKAIDNNTSPRFYFDLRAYRKSMREQTTPFTPAVSLIYGLAEALQMMEEEGYENSFKRHFLMRDMVRAAVRAIGLPFFANEEYASPTVTSVRGEGFDPETVRKLMRQDFGIVLAGGQQHLKGKIFRIGHMGYMTPLEMLSTIAALEIALTKAGCKFELGSGVKAAQEVLLG
jgi:aspartate aminotransferase-like enzyme